MQRGNDKVFSSEEPRKEIPNQMTGIQKVPLKLLGPLDKKKEKQT